MKNKKEISGMELKEKKERLMTTLKELKKANKNFFSTGNRKMFKDSKYLIEGNVLKVRCYDFTSQAVVTHWSIDKDLKLTYIKTSI